MRENKIPIPKDHEDHVKDIESTLYHVRCDAPDNILEKGKEVFGVLQAVFEDALNKMKY